MKNFFKKMKINSLDKKNRTILERAMQMQRNGKLEEYGQLIQESEKIVAEKTHLEKEIK